jgi:hypothetical protein
MTSRYPRLPQSQLHVSDRFVDFNIVRRESTGHPLQQIDIVFAD